MKHTFRLVRLLIAPLLIGLLIWGAFPAAADSTLPQPPVQAAATLIYSNNTAVPVANDSCGNSIINVPDTGTITDVDVYMDVSTQWGVGDFTVALISPFTNQLIYLREFGPPDNMQITLDDESGNVMGFQNPPSNMVTGTYQPSNPLSLFDGADSAGNWTLRLCDVNFVDSSNGTINGWTITITTASNTPIDATAACDIGNPDNLVVTINAGDGPFQINATGSTTPSEPIVVPTTGAYTLQGPDRWINLSVVEQGGDTETITLGDFDCVNLNGSIIIPSGAPGSTIGQAGPYPSTLNVSGLGNSITDVNVSILGFGHTFPGDVELLLVAPSGTTALLMTGACNNFGGSVYDFTFDDEAAGQLLIGNGCTSGSYQLSNFDTVSLTAPAPAGPYGATLSVFDGQNPNGTWSLYVYDNAGGDYGDIASWSLDITAPTLPLTVNSSCNAGSLEITINDGDAPFTIDWSRDGVPQTTINAPSTGTYPLMGDTAGPDIFNVTVTEVGGDGQTVAALYSCSVPVDTTVACAADGGLDITINAGDLPFALTYVLNGIPIPPSLGYPLGLLHLGPALDGPSAFTNIQLEELTGDLEDAGIADTSCNVPLDTTMACNGDNLEVTINTGDGPFNITGTGNGLPANSVGVGTTTLTGPAAWLGVTVTEGEGDGQSQLLGDIACSAGTPGLIINATDN